MSVGMTGATIAKDCFAFRGSTMKKPDGAKNVLLVDHTEGQCRAIVGFKDKDSRSPYMCSEPALITTRRCTPALSDKTEPVTKRLRLRFKRFTSSPG